MPTILPTWPHILFGVLEPISLALGSFFPLYDLPGFISGQTPTIPAPETLHASSVALAYQLGNVYSLMALVGVGVCHATTEPRVLRNYLIGLAIGDIGHVYATYLGMGWDAFTDVAAWNALTWGNVGVTTFLFINRLAYFTGVFGYAKAPKAAAKRE
ncbi:uncharacterized protein N7515_008017 [Penicillium bovifimosum]|uniref:DUF7704 domain-containing protein n=1 Tax=Penicillium bovifimosum TaxID=126998 RepID=A0A9W9GMJ6_9EURO|nr:uncharacterized protein N7515_008017 [Penicillium bovifimosum]KAJ5124192.1 hypothetical protein N7515_008017 [Penicillium bovifimosum]